MEKSFFTSESVTSGHPDKVCDLIADSILDEAIRQDPNAHMAVEASIKDDLILVFGEAGTTAVIDYEAIAKRVLREIGYEGTLNFEVEVPEPAAIVPAGMRYLAAIGKYFVDVYEQYDPNAKEEEQA